MREYNKGMFLRDNLFYVGMHLKRKIVRFTLCELEEKIIFKIEIRYRMSSLRFFIIIIIVQ